MQPSVDVKRLLARRNCAYNRKLNWQTILQKTYRYSQPNRNVFDVQPMGESLSRNVVQGENINWYVFDLTCSHGTDIYVNRLINAIVPPGKQWLNFVAGTDVPKEYVHKVNEQLQELTKRFFKFVHQSNFDLVVYECFMDMAVSTGFMVVNEYPDDSNPLIFASMPPHITYADEGPWGTFDAFYRDFIDLPLEHAYEMWPDFVCPENVKFGDVEEPKINLYEMTYKDYKTKKWIYVIIHPDTQKVCYSRVDDTSAWIGFRAKKLSGETYGRGVAMDAMPAAATVNQVMYDEIMSANMRALPIYMGFDDGVFNPWTFKLVPNTVIACNPSASGTWPIAPLPVAGDINWGQIVLQDLREQINRVLLTDPFGPIDAPKQTATEIIARQQQILENSSASFARLQREFFDPLVDRIINILKKRGLWDDVEVDGQIISVKYETPLVTSQGQEAVLKFAQFHNFIASIFGPQAASGFYNQELVSPWAALNLNIDLALIKNSQELLEVFQQMDVMQKEMIQRSNQNVPALPPAA